MISINPELRHHFSYQSGVSLALPRSWVAGDVARTNLVAFYHDEGASPPPSLAIQVFQVGAGRPDAFRQVAATAAGDDRPAYRLLGEAETTVDARPAWARVAVFAASDDLALAEHMTAVQVGDAVYVFIGAVPLAASEAGLPVIARAVASARFLAYPAYEAWSEPGAALPSEPLSLFDDELMLSLLVPPGWEAARGDPFPLEISARAEHGYRAHLSFGLTPLEGATVAGFEALVRDWYDTQGLDLPRYRLEAGGRIELAGRPAFVAYFDWYEETSRSDLSQIDVLVLGDARLHVIHAYMLKATSATYTPIFEEVIGSIRFIPHDE